MNTKDHCDGDNCSMGAMAVLDDIERTGEQDILARWEREHGLQFDVRTEAGIAIGTWPGAGP